MISTKEYLKALKIVNAYHAQTLAIAEKVAEIQNVSEVQKPVNKYKNYMQVETGDIAECIAVHSHSTEHLTKGKQYEIVRVELSYNEREKTIYIIGDKGVRKSYSSKNTQFKIFS